MHFNYLSNEISLDFETLEETLPSSTFTNFIKNAVSKFYNESIEDLEYDSINQYIDDRIETYGQLLIL